MHINLQPAQIRPVSTAQPLRAAAEQLEAQFLTQMLKDTGLGATPTAFGGGAGEGHFSSLLVEERARAMVSAGGIGLAESIFNALKGGGYGRD